MRLETIDVDCPNLGPLVGGGVDGFERPNHMAALRSISAIQGSPWPKPC